MNSRIITLFFLALAAGNLRAASAADDDVLMKASVDPSVNEINRYPMRATFCTGEPRISLHGLWDFQFNGGEWRKMPVPGMWELNGCGDPIYVNIGYAWRGHYKNNPPYPAEVHNYRGLYRKTVTVPADWKGSDIFLHLGSVTSCVEVLIDGKSVGYSEDSKLEACFDITKSVRPGTEQTIELKVRRWCDGTYMEDQDFWRFTGIARESYLAGRPKERIEDIRITAGADGSYKIQTMLTKGIRSVKCFIDGKEVPAEGNYPSPRLWSAEEPNLYELKVEAYDTRNRLCETAALQFGFRTVEIKGRQVLVNGKPVLFKGADRHEMSAAGGYVVSEEEMIRDIRIMKELNINAVRTSHYPNDPRWLALCDRYGLYVVDEANNESHGMGYGDKTLAKDPQYALTHLQRVQRMVYRDINHPSVIFWSLGNEAGNGPNFGECFRWLKAYDSTRPVQYERATEFDVDYNASSHGSGFVSEIYCPMYPSRKTLARAKKDGKCPVIFCEYAHAMGNSMGGFKDYWDYFRAESEFQGGFIWDFVDQAICWPSKKGGTDHIYAFGGDFNSYDASDNSFNCNGVIAADRSLHPHAEEVRHQYQSIWTRPLAANLGRIEVFNENFFHDLSRYALRWELISDGKAVLCGTYDALDAAPQKSQAVDLAYDANSFPGELFLNLSYVLKKPDGILPAGQQVAAQQISVREGFNRSRTADLRDNMFSFDFDAASGALSSYKINGRELIKAPMMPCFGRAVTENDLGAKLHKKMGAWLYPDMKLLSFEKNDASAKAVYDVAGLAKVTVTYSFLPDGSIDVSEDMSDVAKDTPALFRFGMELGLDGGYGALDFYGRGPWENYCDRNSSSAVGIWRQRVEDQYHWGYVRPQESGTHTDMRWMEVKDDAGFGMRFTSLTRFSGSAIPFSRRDIDMSLTGGGRSDGGDQSHSLEKLDKACLGHRSDGVTWVNLDLMQMGLGCINSWSELPFEEYRMPARDYRFRFRITPVVK